MKHRFFTTIFFLLATFSMVAQSFNAGNVTLANYLVRMYESAPFEGARIVDDYSSTMLVCVFSLDGASFRDESILNRVASVKAMSIASRFFNGAEISSETIIHMHDNADGRSDTEIIERVREKSIGYVKSLEQLTNFKNRDGRIVFIFVTKQ